MEATRAYLRIQSPCHFRLFPLISAAEFVTSLAVGLVTRTVSPSMYRA